MLRGEPSTFYFDGGLKDKIRSVTGVEKTSVQLFIASFSADCCSLPVQLIGFDPQTDFVIQPWLKAKIHGGIHDGEIVVGSSVNADAGDTLTFFCREYKVAARLDKTGMGFDSSVFMNTTTARKAVLDYVKMGGQSIPSDENSISSIVINAKSGYSVSDVANNILKAYGKGGIDVVVTKNIISSVSGGIRALLFFICILAAILWILSVCVLAIVFSITLSERKREFGMFRALGATRKKLVHIILCESALISLSGAVIGVFFACLLLFPFSTYIGASLNMPYLQPSVGIILIILVASLLISFAVGPIASVYSAIKIGTSETYTMLREEEV